MKAKSGEEIDHKNGDGLNNCGYNLRKCTSLENLHNQKKRNLVSGKKTSSIYKGVSWFKRTKKWHVQITSNYKNIHLGYFDSEIEAALEYDLAAVQYFKEFARLNHPCQ